MPSPDRSAPVWMLACGQTLGYASLFYIFPALILSLESALGWGRGTLAAGPTLAVVIAAGLAPVAGRLVDRGFGPALMGGGAILGAVALAGLARAETPAGYLAAWGVIGLAQSASLYEVCFAVLVRRFGAAARPAIIRVTLVAGFASSLAFPAGAVLADLVGWRGAVWVAAAAMALIVAPLHLVAARRLHRASPPPAGPTEARAGLHAALRRPAFWLLMAVFALLSLNHWVLINFLVPVLIEQGAARGVAVLAASLVGPSQVVGRLVLMRYEARIGSGMATRLTIAGMIAASLALMAAGLTPALVFAFALLQGAALGVLTILRPVMVAETLGPEAFGAVAGVIAVPSLAASAAGPVLGAALLGLGDAPLLIATALALAVAALVLATLAARRSA